MIYRHSVERDLQHEVIDEPGFSCPLIDEGLDTLDRFKDEIDESLEKIRTRNTEIREWGNAWKEKAIELKTELIKAEEEKEELEVQVKELKEQLQLYEKEAA